MKRFDCLVCTFHIIHFNETWTFEIGKKKERNMSASRKQCTLYTLEPAKDGCGELSLSK